MKENKVWMIKALATAKWGLPFVLVRAIRLVLFTVPRFNFQSLISLWFWQTNILILLGWILGFALAEADDLIYALVSSPQELTSQRVKKELQAKNFSGMMEILQSTKAERTKLPIRNVLTGIVMAVLGVWLLTSGRSYLGFGMVTALNIMLFWDFFRDRDYKRWYWTIARDFSFGEHQVVEVIWGGMVFIQVVMLVLK